MGHDYTVVQKLSLAGTIIGTIMCIVGGLSPYWVVSDPQAEGGFAAITAVIKIADKVVKGYMGLVMYCVHVNVLVAEETECNVFDMSDQKSVYYVAFFSALVCMKLGLLSSLISLYLACCNCCKRFICLGILNFLAAGSGAICIIVYHSKVDVFTTNILGFQLSSYGWSFYVFCFGVGILGLVSFTACFAAPSNPLRGVVMGSNQPTSVMVGMNQTSAYTHLEEAGAPRQDQVNVVGFAPAMGMNTGNGY